MDKSVNISNWVELSECKSTTHKINVNIKEGGAWILPVNNKGNSYYLSTQSFKRDNCRHSTETLKRCGFKVKLKPNI